MDSAIRLVGVTKTFPGSATPAVDHLDLDLPRAAITVLVGPSGCGKTTVLRMINRLIEPNSGQVLVDGVDVRSQPTHVLRRQIGYVIQHGGLFPHRSVADNIATVPRLEGWSTERIDDRVAELAELVGLGPELLHRYPAALSGGQRQRVGVARALAADPPVLLMDEPYSAVDPIVRARLQDELLALQARLAKTVVVVTHDIDEAIRLADRLAVVRTGAHLEQFATPDEVLANPATPFVEEFIGRDRFLRRANLLTVAEAPLAEVTVLRPDTPAAAALAELARPSGQPSGRRNGRADRGLDERWAVVVDDDGVPLGWVSEEALGGLPVTATVGDAHLDAVGVTVRESAVLHTALDTVVGTPWRAATVVDDDGRLAGVVTADGVATALQRTR